MLYRGRGKAYPEPDKGLERQSDWIYAVFSCSDIQKSADPGCFFVLFIVLPDRLYIWELICLPCTKSTRILDMRGNFFSICPNASHTGCRGNLCPPDWHLRPGRRLLAPQTTGIFTCFPRNKRNSILNN